MPMERERIVENLIILGLVSAAGKYRDSCAGQKRQQHKTD